MRLLGFTFRLCIIFGLAMPALAADDQPSEEDIKGKAAQELATAKRLIDAKQYQRAIGHLQEARDANGDNADIHNYLGYAYRNLGKYDASMRSYDKALDLDPDHKGALEYQGELFLMLKQPDRAKRLLERLRKLCPDGCEELEDLEKGFARYDSR